LASGGVLARGTLYRHFESSAPVPTFANPRPTAKPQGVIGKRDSAVFSRQFGENLKSRRKNIKFAK